MLLKQWPALTRHYPGLFPWMLDRFTAAEISEYLRQMPRGDE